eukprot:scaffold18042_cov65-Phaeocystis_antarctica.AAC.3
MSPRRSAVVVTASSVVPRAPLLSEAAAESAGHAVPFELQAKQAAHSGLSLSSIVTHTLVGQHASHEALAEIRPSLLIDTDGIMVLQAVTAA